MRPTHTAATLLVCFGVTLVLVAVVLWKQQALVLENELEQARGGGEG